MLRTAKNNKPPKISKSKTLLNKPRFFNKSFILPGILLIVAGTILVLRAFAATTAVTYAGSLRPHMEEAAYSLSTGNGQLSIGLTARSRDLEVTVKNGLGITVSSAKSAGQRTVYTNAAVTPGVYTVVVRYPGVLTTTKNFTLRLNYPLADATKPSAVITSPVSGDMVSGTVRFAATATDDTGVNRVEFYAGSTLLGTDTQAPYEVNWDTTKNTSGMMVQLTVKSYDAANNMGVASITTMVHNMTSPAPPPSTSNLPTGNPGSSQALITSGAPKGDPSPTGISAFRIECGYSHMNYDDPIVYPNQVGAAHLHTFFGNTSTNATSTYQSLRTGGNSTCSGGILNRSAYWVPTLMNGATPIAPTKTVVYYKSGYPSVKPAVLKNIPDGLRMITGTSSSSSPQNSGFTFIEWYCQSKNNAQYAIPACSAGDELILSISFPQCWDGANLDSANHKSHMSFPVSYSGGEGCPSTHPVAIPQISFLVHWAVPSAGTAGWRLSSDMYASTTPGGYSAHADYMDGWDPAIRNTFTASCLVAAKDCQVRWLGDGRSLVNVPGVN